MNVKKYWHQQDSSMVVLYRCRSLSLWCILSCAVVLFLSEVSMAQEDISPAKQEASDLQESIQLAVESPILKSIDSTTIAAPVAGIIQSVRIKEGMRVKAGEELAKIKDTAIRILAEKAKVSVEKAKKQLDSDIDLRLATKSMEVAKNEFERAVEANAKVADVYPRNEIDRLRLVMDRSILEMERTRLTTDLLQMELRIAEWEYKQHLEQSYRHSITSPCDGIILSVEKRPGEWIELGGGMAEVIEIDKLRIEGFLQAESIHQDMIGTKALVVVESPVRAEAEAELVFVSPEVNPLNSQVRVFLEVDNQSGKLRPGMRPKVTLLKKQ